MAETTKETRPLEDAPDPERGPEIEARPRARRKVSREVQNRVLLYVVRGLFVLTAAGIGLFCWRRFGQGAEDVVDPVFVILGACVIAAVMMVGEVFFSKAAIRTLAAITFGLLIGLALSRVSEPVVDVIIATTIGAIPQEDLQNIQDAAKIILATVFSYYAISVLLQTRDDFKFVIPYVEFRKDVKGHVPLVIDTSTIIDGRVSALLETGILDQRLIVPRFVLNELQDVADSADKSRRERGRRGLDILQELRARHAVEILEHDLSANGAVDSELLLVAEDVGGKLLTTDYNLQKRATVQGVAVINVNDLATALKPVVIPGESVRVRLLRAGESPGQAVGYLSDGTMVVVESADRRIGQDVDVEVTSSTQTSAGKMIFGRVARRGGGGRDGRDGRDGGRRQRPRAAKGSSEGA